MMLMNLLLLLAAVFCCTDAACHVVDCAVCENESICTACMTGFSLLTISDMYYCQLCYAEDCAVCEDESICTACKPGFALFNMYCYGCEVENCAECDTDRTTCDACMSGFVLNGMACQEGSASNQLARMNTTCGATQVKVTLDANEVSDMDTSHLHVGIDSNNLECQGVTSGDIITFSIGLGQCDPAVVDEEGNIVFTYDIFGNSTKEAGVITRLNTMGIQITCSYPQNTKVSTHFKGGVSISEYLGSAEGQFRFSLGLFSDLEMDTSLAEGSEIPVGTPLYVGIHFAGPPSLQMTIVTCMATPTASPDDATTKWYLAKNGCYGGTGMDDTFAPIESRVEDHAYGFTFDSFHFVGVETSAVYITCEVHVCVKEEGDCIQPVEDRTCLDARSKRSESQSAGFPITSVAFMPVG